MFDEMREIVDEFLDESNELLESVMGDVMDLEEVRDDEVVNRIYRALHSVKGNAAMLGFDNLSAFAHKAESLLSLIRTGEAKIDKPTVELLLHVLDVLKLVLSDIRAGRDDGRDTGAAAQLLEDLAREAEAPRTAGPGATPLSESEKPPRRAAEGPSPPAAPPSEPSPLPEKGPRGEAPSAGEEAESGGFAFDLEREEEKSPPSPPPPRPSPRPQTAAVREGPAAPLKILIAEDDFTSRIVLSSFLAKYGDCHVAKDGLEAIQAFAMAHDQDPPAPYHLILMDIRMPRMEGTTAAKTIREIERGKGVEGTKDETVIVMISALDDPGTIVKACYECGANYYFTKPLELPRVKRQLQKLGLVPSDS